MTMWSEHVKNGEAFAGEDFILGAPGLYPHLQLFNPPGSGKRVRLRSVHTTQGISQQVNIRRYDPPGVILGPPAPFVVENMLGGGPANGAELRHDNIVVPSGGAFWLLSQAGSGSARNTYPPEGQEWGMDLLETHGILLQGTAGQTLIAMWLWVELPL